MTALTATCAAGAAQTAAPFHEVPIATATREPAAPPPRAPEIRVLESGRDGLAEAVPVVRFALDAQITEDPGALPLHVGLTAGPT